MTDDRRLEIERRFDGELDGLGPASPVEDPEARQHLDRLSRLRDLSRRHDPAATAPRREFKVPDRRPRRTSWLVVAGVAAAAVLAYVAVEFRTKPPDIAVLVVKPAQPPVITRPVEPSVARPPLEVELYGWANTPTRAPKQVARLVISPGSPSRKRSPADEILALELANAPAQARSGVQRFAVSKGSKPAPPSTKPVTRPKVPFPEV
jgi:hypothetical protein